MLFIHSAVVLVLLLLLLPVVLRASYPLIDLFINFRPITNRALLGQQQSVSQRFQKLLTNSSN